MKVYGRDTMCTGPHDFIPAPSVAHVFLNYREFGQQLQNNLWFLGLAQWDTSSLRELADAAIANWVTDMGAEIATAVQLFSVIAKDMEVLDGAAVERIPGSTLLGTRNNEPMPSGVTLTTTFLTELTGRSHRGRVYNVGITDDMVSGNAVSAILAGTISSNWDNFITHMIEGCTNAAGQVVASYCYNLNWRTTAEITPVTGFRTEVNIDSQRRRLTGRGL